MGVDDRYPDPVAIAKGQDLPLDLRQMGETDVRETGCPCVGASGSKLEFVVRRGLPTCCKEASAGFVPAPSHMPVRHSVDGPDNHKREHAGNVLR